MSTLLAMDADQEVLGELNAVAGAKKQTADEPTVTAGKPRGFTERVSIPVAEGRRRETACKRASIGSLRDAAALNPPLPRQGVSLLVPVAS
jgi:hypothetical protein